MNLLVITRKVDHLDSRMGFFVDWIIKLTQKVDKLYVIAWQKGNQDDLPQNVSLLELKGSKFIKVLTLQRYLWRYLKKVDGIFCHMNPEYTIIVWPLSKLFGKKIVSWYTHKSVTLKRRFMEIFAKKILTASEKSFRKPLFSKKVQVVGHGINTELFNFTIKPGDFSILTMLSVGRISPTKDIESMIKAVNILDKESVSIKLDIIGETALKSDKTYFANLIKMVKKMGLESKVKFLQAKPYQELPLYYKKANLFINLSKTGSLDKVVLEAMASGSFVLTSNEAFVDILDKRWMVKQNNPKDLAQKIKELLQLPGQEFTNETERLRAYVEKEHNLKNTVEKIINEFN